MDADTGATFPGSSGAGVSVIFPGRASADFAVEAWVKTTSRGGTIVAQSVGNDPCQYPPGGSSDIVFPGFRVSVASETGFEGRVRAVIADGLLHEEPGCIPSRRLVAYGPTPRVDDGEWHQVVVNFLRPSGISIYVDGVSAFTPGASLGSISNDLPFTIGMANEATSFAGAIDEVAVYDQPLPEARIIAHFDAASGDVTLDPDGTPVDDEESADPYGETSDPAESAGPEPFAGEAPLFAQTTSTTIDRDAILSYARTYVGTYHDQKGRLNDRTGWNPNYRTYANDCQNFVSQALFAGGWPMTPFDRHRGWYYDPGPLTTLSWVNAKWFVRYVNVYHPNERATLLRYIWNVIPGDVIAVDWHGTEGGTDPIAPIHSMVVTSRYVMADGRLFVGVTYHTSNRLDKSLRALIRAHPRGVWWAFRLKSTF